MDLVEDEDLGTKTETIIGGLNMATTTTYEFSTVTVSGEDDTHNDNVPNIPAPADIRPTTTFTFTFTNMLTTSPTMVRRNDS